MWELQLLQSREVSCAWNDGGGTGIGKMLPTIVTVDEMQFCFMP